MPDRLFVGVLGHRRAGKSTSWNRLFGRTVKTGNRSRKLELRPGESVEVFLVSGSPQERKKYTGSILKNLKIGYLQIGTGTVHMLGGPQKSLYFDDIEIGDKHAFYSDMIVNSERGKLY